jgi:UDP:flavonoid glycosyltransferase YjiC (YdhE family)
MTDPDPERTTRVLLEAIARAGIRAIVSSGWAGLGATLPPECLAVGEVPHDALFSRLAGAVHHGGAGTTATAARAGIPQPIVPHMLDQFYWAHRTATLGIGPRAIPKRSLDGRRLAAGMMALTRDEGMRRAARSLGALLRPRDGVAAAVKAIEFAMGQAPVTRRAPYAR